MIVRDKSSPSGLSVLASSNAFPSIVKSFHIVIGPTLQCTEVEKRISLSNAHVTGFNCRVSHSR